VTPRERLVATATRLFCQRGVHVGLDRITAEADVALMTVYRHFGGKQGLLAAALARWSDQWLQRMRERLDRAGMDPRSPLEGLWEALEEWFATDDFSGSLIDDAARELRNAPAHPAHQVITAHHRETRRLLTDLAELAGVVILGAWRSSWSCSSRVPWSSPSGIVEPPRPGSAGSATPPSRSAATLYQAGRGSWWWRLSGTVELAVAGSGEKGPPLRLGEGKHLALPILGVADRHQAVQEGHLDAVRRGTVGRSAPVVGLNRRARVSSSENHNVVITTVKLG
jgi:AcrR family transcriptional regulator